MLSSLGFLIFAIPVAVIALCIWRQAGSPVLFYQARIGQKGDTFQIKKFRTMNSQGQVFSSFAQGLRNTAMDELPQLFHILRGEMSFVGPRPLIPEELLEIRQIPNGSRRFLVKPGLAGLAQINAQKIPSLAERSNWDLLYVDQYSLLLDIRIVMKSIWVTLRGNWEGPGAHS